MCSKQSINYKSFKHMLFIGIFLNLAYLLQGCNFLRGYADGRSDAILIAEKKVLPPIHKGFLRFIHDDFGHLNTDTLENTALPWKIVNASLAMHLQEKAESPAHLSQIYENFGFFTPSAFENLPEGLEQPKFQEPLGFVVGTISRNIPQVKLKASTLGCAACHAGRLYDENGLATRRAWIGLPNTSLDLDAFTKTIYKSLQHSIKSEEKLIHRIGNLYPSTNQDEIDTIIRHAIPAAKKRLQKLATTIDRPLGFRNGGPGITNGVAALKTRMGLLDEFSLAHEYGYTSIPDLGATHLRSSLLYDGLYAPPKNKRFMTKSEDTIAYKHLSYLAAITAFFTIPAQGATPESAERAIPAIKDTFNFIKAYRSPPFPGQLDHNKSQRGKKIYNHRCQHCHGRYDDHPLRPKLIEFPNKLVPQAKMQTDPQRWQAADSKLIAALKGSRLNKYINPKQNKGYVSTALTGLWATAPYLHNGSVPTLWHLMNPELRPQKFTVGGHKLDYKLMGIAGELVEGVYRYQSEYKPFAKPMLYDTTKLGKSNKGHEQPFAKMTKSEKVDLLEYLKTL